MQVPDPEQTGNRQGWTLLLVLELFATLLTGMSEPISSLSSCDMLHFAAVKQKRRPKPCGLSQAQESCKFGFKRPSRPLVDIPHTHLLLILNSVKQVVDPLAQWQRKLLPSKPAVEQFAILVVLKGVQHVLDLIPLEVQCCHGAFNDYHVVSFDFSHGAGES